jgi:von Willebrand factor type A domain
MAFTGLGHLRWPLLAAVAFLLGGLRANAVQDSGAAPGAAPKSSVTKSAASPSTAKPSSRHSGASDKGSTKTKTPSRNASRGAPPQVMSKEAADAKRPRSPFLMPPGSSPQDRYAPADDWGEPPWRQTSFFGIQARGQFFIYVLDQSGSMLDDDRLTRAKIELRKSVYALQPPQRFEVIFYNDEATPMPGGPLPRSADQATKNQLTTWLHLIEPDGETNPRSALAMALALRPDAVFLLSDGEFPKGTVEAVVKLNPRKIPIHCIDLTGGLAGDHLVRIARDSGGHYASRPGSLQATP